MNNKTINNFCGLHAAHVVLSEHNDNGDCVCLRCPGLSCQSCWKHKELLKESKCKNKSRLERCINCLNQR